MRIIDEQNYLAIVWMVVNRRLWFIIHITLKVFGSEDCGK
jgi:hypothetical protein